MKKSVIIWWGLAVLLQILFLGFFIYYYPSITGEVPVHYNFWGEVDAYGTKESVWIPLLCNWAVFALLSVLLRYPQHYNYPVRQTEHNRESLYAQGQVLVAQVSLYSSLMFFSVCGAVLVSAEHFPMWLSLLIVLLIFGHIGFAFYQMRKSST